MKSVSELSSTASGNLSTIVGNTEMLPIATLKNNYTYLTKMVSKWEASLKKL